MARDGSMIEKVSAYVSERTATMRQAGVMIATCIVFWAIARSPDFHLRGLFGIEGEIHNGYVGAYGHFILGALIAVYSWRLTECLAMRERILTDLALTPKLHTANRNTERFLLRVPFERDLPEYFFRVERLQRFIPAMQRAISLAPLLPYLIGTFVYGLFLVNYFRFHRPGHEAERYRDLFFGGMFQGAWDLRMGNSPTIAINAPLQTWVGLIVGAFLVYRLFVVAYWTVRASRRQPLVYPDPRPADAAAVRDNTANVPVNPQPSNNIVLQPAASTGGVAAATTSERLSPEEKLHIQDYVLSLARVYGAISITILTLVGAFFYSAMDAIAHSYVTVAVEKHMVAVEKHLDEKREELKRIEDDFKTTREKVLRQEAELEGIVKTGKTASTTAESAQRAADEAIKINERAKQASDAAGKDLATLKDQQDRLNTILREGTPELVKQSQAEFDRFKNQLQKIEERLGKVENKPGM